MAKMLLVQGGASVNGKLAVSGAKNSAIPLIVYATMSRKRITLRNVPNITDIHNLISILRELGVDTAWDVPSSTLEIHARELIGFKVNAELAKRLRGSFALIGPLIHRQGRAVIPFPGGDRIGSRPLDECIRGLRMMGATVCFHDDSFYVSRETELKGIDITLVYPSHITTVLFMALGAVANGSTVIRHAAKEPEVNDMQDFLRLMGVQVTGAGTSEIRVEGTAKLEGCEFDVMPDRLQVGTYIIAALMTNGELTIPISYLTYLTRVIDLLMAAGAEVEVTNGGDMVTIRGRRPYKSFDFETGPYPDFPTDLQAPMTALLLTCEGSSYVRENVYENRFLHVPELRILGAHIEKANDREVIIHGGHKLVSGRSVRMQDIRGGAALLLSALSMESGSYCYIKDFYHLDRGYPNYIETFRELGINTISIVDDKLVP